MDKDVNWELILHRLDEMSKNQESLNRHMESLEEKLTSVNGAVEAMQGIKSWKGNMEEAVSIGELKDIKVWKQRVDDVLSPSQLKTIVEEVEGLKTFKTQAMMIWVVVQAIMAILIFMKDFM